MTKSPTLRWLLDTNATILHVDQQKQNNDRRTSRDLYAAVRGRCCRIKPNNIVIYYIWHETTTTTISLSCLYHDIHDKYTRLRDQDMIFHWRALMDFPTVYFFFFLKHVFFAEIQFEFFKKKKKNKRPVPYGYGRRTVRTRGTTRVASCGPSIRPASSSFLAVQRKRLVRIGRVSTSPITAANATTTADAKTPPSATPHIVAETTTPPPDRL